mmetsp:Transcript_81292/g.230721  ORF Transcript_81292/g.230721 Transcript_81292/m.230721 type:complete len:384 (+) Transcript_81292:264-1415(+)
MDRIDGALICVFWKMAFSILVIGTYVIIASGGPREVFRGLLESPKHTLTGFVLETLTATGFTLALALTHPARALLFISLNPLWCALFGRAFLEERLPVRTLVVLFLCLVCILVVFLPEILEAEGKHGTGGHASEGASGANYTSAPSPAPTVADANATTANNNGNGGASDDGDEGAYDATMELGDAISFLTGITMAGYITTVRHASKYAPDANMPAVMICGLMGAGVISFSLAAGRVMPHAAGWNEDQDEDGPVAHFWLIMTADALCSCGLFIALSVGPRYISGAEVALIMLLEVLVGPLWLALIYADLPGTYTIIGGMSLVFFLAAHEALVLLGLAEAEDDGEEEGEGERANGEDTKGGGGRRGNPRMTRGAPPPPRGRPARW